MWPLLIGLLGTAPDPSLRPIEETPGRPRVLLIGDSISMGYTLPVRRRLEGRANVLRVLENGGPTSNGVAKLEAWLGDGAWDVIHFNFGLHDIKVQPDGTRQVPIEAYEANLRRIVTRLRETGAALIWATTTPVPEGPVNPPRVPADVTAYNRVAALVMAEFGVPTNDLYGLALPRLAELQQPVNVHFRPAGSEALAEQVAAHIGAALAGRR